VKAGDQVETVTKAVEVEPCKGCKGKSCCSTVAAGSEVQSPTNNAFALAIGGGIDIAVSEHFAIRLVDADYELTRFGNNFTGGNNSQSNFRFQTGVQFRF
jgi:opacity protein-like surface antigen